MTWQPLPFPDPGNGQHLPGPIRGAHTLGLVLTRVQVRGAEVHQLLTGPSWRKNQGEAGEKLSLPPAPCWCQAATSRNLLPTLRQGPNGHGNGAQGMHTSPHPPPPQTLDDHIPTYCRGHWQV